ncbi:GtrA family protein [Patescibacteria group bacterium]|nr:GtrA family protein [Patescibacteria group bacterium]
MEIRGILNRMKLLDVIFALICGEASALLINDSLGGQSFFNRFLQIAFLFLIPILAILFLWLADLASKKFFFVWQLAKHLLIGLLVVLIDLKIFLFLTDLLKTDSSWFLGATKAISFFVSVSTIKFFGNKYWAFEEKKREGLAKQFAVFLILTIVGSIIDVGAFLFLIKFTMPQLGLTSQIWVKISVIVAAAVAAAWNFITYKFIVFKKQNVSGFLS